LGGVLADEVFDGLCVLGREPFNRVGFVFPFGGKNYAVYADFEKEFIVFSSAVSDADGDIVCRSQKGDAFVSARLSAEKVDEDTFSAGILVGNEAQRCAFGGDFVHELGGAFFVDDFLACPLAHIVEIIVDEPVILSKKTV